MDIFHCDKTVNNTSVLAGPAADQYVFCCFGCCRLFGKYCSKSFDISQQWQRVLGFVRPAAASTEQLQERNYFTQVCFNMPVFCSHTFPNQLRAVFVKIHLFFLCKKTKPKKHLLVGMLLNYCLTLIFWFVF